MTLVGNRGQSMAPSEAEKVAYAFETELRFECNWFNQTWSELEALLLQGDSPMVADTNLYNLNVWSFIDRLLNHAVRIDRMLNPRDYSSRDSHDSRKARASFSRKAHASLPADAFNEGDLKAIRDSVEHANERIPAFIAGREMNLLKPFLIGPLVVKTSPGAVDYLRGFNPSTGLCVVFGEPVDLNLVRRSVQSLLLVLPPLHVHTQLLLPPEPGSDQPRELLREEAIGHAHSDSSGAGDPSGNA
jgi:hypothetical protein